MRYLYVLLLLTRSRLPSCSLGDTGILDVNGYKCGPEMGLNANTHHLEGIGVSIDLYIEPHSITACRVLSFVTVWHLHPPIHTSIHQPTYPLILSINLSILQFTHPPYPSILYIQPLSTYLTIHASIYYPPT